MEGIKDFLESSTVHGLTYISTTRKLVRLFWIIVVILGFSGAGYLIYTSFQDWDESPVKTTIESRPITEITLPKITVCPPKNTFTDLNYDLMKLKDETIDNETRIILKNYAFELLNDLTYDELMRNLSKLEDNDRYYNWYHGYTLLQMPYYGRIYDGDIGMLDTKDYYGIYYNIETYATSGIITTQYFGENFKVDKVEPHLYYTITVNRPESVTYDSLANAHFEIEKIRMKDFTTGGTIWMMDTSLDTEFLDDDNRHFSKNYTPPETYTSLILKRRVTMEDVAVQSLSLIPGFRFSWYYSSTTETTRTTTTITTTITTTATTTESNMSSYDFGDWSGFESGNWSVFESTNNSDLSNIDFGTVVESGNWSGFESDWSKRRKRSASKKVKMLFEPEAHYYDDFKNRHFVR